MGHDLGVMIVRMTGERAQHVVETDLQVLQRVGSDRHRFGTRFLIVVKLHPEHAAVHNDVPRSRDRSIVGGHPLGQQPKVTAGLGRMPGVDLRRGRVTGQAGAELQHPQIQRLHRMQLGQVLDKGAVTGLKHRRCDHTPPA
jgi:hypothetical protein